MPGRRKPRALRSGAVIGIAAPAGPIELDLLEQGEAWLRALGFEPRRRVDLTDHHGYLAGDDERRAAEWAELIDDDAIEGILCARGGYGCHRIMARLDPAPVRAAAKPLMGYSDITTLLAWQEKHAGLTGFHGPMLEKGDALDDASREALGRAFRGEAMPALEGRALAGGHAEGRMVGGSLSLVCASLGTAWEIDTRGAILMLEEIAEQPYRLDRMLQQLLHAGKLEGLAGVGVGQLVDCVGTRYPVPTPEQAVAEVVGALGVPVVTDLPFGHTAHHLPWAYGIRARIDGDAGRIETIESAVAE